MNIPSVACYYLEDLTVSGRTYAKVDALDYAEYLHCAIDDHVTAS